MPAGAGYVRSAIIQGAAYKRGVEKHALTPEARLIAKFVLPPISNYRGAPGRRPCHETSEEWS